LLAPNILIELIHNRYPESLHKPLKLNKFELLSRTTSNENKGEKGGKTNRKMSAKFFMRENPLWITYQFRKD